MLIFQCQPNVKQRHMCDSFKIIPQVEWKSVNIKALDRTSFLFQKKKKKLLLKD